MTTKFGIEIEFYGLGNSPQDVAAALTDSGMENVRGERYNHTTRRHWKVVTDRSVYDGCELVSPPLKFNQENLTKVKEVFGYLNANSCYVDSRCGMHVHVDASFVANWSASIQEKFFQFLLKCFQKHEEKFDSFVKNNRRLSNNSYCYSMQGTEYRNVRSDRFRKLNFAAYARHGTIEFRQFQGTMNGDAAVAWITLCVTFLANVRKQFEMQLASVTTVVSRPVTAETSYEPNIGYITTLVSV